MITIKIILVVISIRNSNGKIKRKRPEYDGRYAFCNLVVWITILSLSLFIYFFIHFGHEMHSKIVPPKAEKSVKNVRA